MLICTTYATNTAKSHFKMPLASFCPLYLHYYHPSPRLFIFSHRSWQDCPNWSHWLLSFSAESNLACHYQISFPKTLLSWCNYLPRGLQTVRRWKKPPGPTFHSHAFLSTLSNKLPKTMIFDLKLAIFIPLHLCLLMVFTYLPNLRGPSLSVSVHLFP